MIALGNFTGWIDRLSTRRRLASYASRMPLIVKQQQQLSRLSDSDLRRSSLALRYRAQTGEPLDRLLNEAFAHAREAAKRALGMEHFDVQLIGGAALHFGHVIEMQTGEGKTLTASLPLYLAALAGRGAHLATANDYLAMRDADIVRPLFTLLGLTVGSIAAATPRDARQSAYACDITYGTAKEFGFDFLRDRLLLAQSSEGASNRLRLMTADEDGLTNSHPSLVQRPLYSMLVDEADSSMIDEARTPLVVSALPGEKEAQTKTMYRWAAESAGELSVDKHYEVKPRTNAIVLTPQGRRRVRELASGRTSQSVQPTDLPVDAPLLDLYQHLELAIRAARDYLRDRHYLVREGEVVIVDEFTGRLAEGRRWRDGIHQAIEAREEVDISLKTGDAARITIQDYMLRYERLAGMTGTAANSANELSSIYRTPVAVIPTHRPPRRVQLPELVFGDRDAKWAAIVAEVAKIHRTGRPVLIGTRSVDKSEHLSKLLTAGDLEHRVLNARHIAEEARIIATAGERGRITVATNMAGRGTDIQLGRGVSELGGLHVILSELHESARIDRQLIGRCGRQGDPGSYRIFLALDDNILTAGWGAKRAERLREIGQQRPDGWQRYAKVFHQGQARIEREHFRGRQRLLEFERDRRDRQTQLGQDPFLEAAA